MRSTVCVTTHLLYTQACITPGESSAWYHGRCVCEYVRVCQTAVLLTDKRNTDFRPLIPKIPKWGCAMLWIRLSKLAEVKLGCKAFKASERIKSGALRWLYCDTAIVLSACHRIPVVAYLRNSLSLDKKWKRNLRLFVWLCCTIFNLRLGAMPGSPHGWHECVPIPVTYLHQSETVS